MSILAAYAVPHPPLIIPAIGAGREREIAATVRAYHEVMRAAAALRPDTVVIISPHATAFRMTRILCVSSLLLRGRRSFRREHSGRSIRRLTMGR